MAKNLFPRKMAMMKCSASFPPWYGRLCLGRLYGVSSLYSPLLGLKRGMLGRECPRPI